MSTSSNVTTCIPKDPYYSTTTCTSSLLNDLKISPFLKVRVQQRRKLSSLSSSSSSSSSLKPNKRSNFILYIPTVNLRIDQNPAFALACQIANHYELPLLILVVLLDDSSMPISSPYHSNHRQTKQDNDKQQHQSQQKQQHKFIPKEITMTARRLAFLTEAVAFASQQWSTHGAGVAIRVHKPKTGRIPDHLTLATRAKAVITDEPFVHPFLNFVMNIENVCYKSGVPCYRVDGSTTVPPCSVLHKNRNHINATNKEIYYTGVPAKAWIYQKQTEHLRHDQIQAAMDGHFDPPPLLVRIDDHDFFIDKNRNSATANDDNNSGDDKDAFDPMTFPLHWRNKNNEAPGIRPWTVSELCSISSIKEWAMEWPGSDSTVPPCSQTVGTYKAGMQRWNKFVQDQKGLVYYAKRRTDPLQPHASSRMSCYLNFGIVSIFRIAHEVKSAQKKNVSGADKFEEEIVKWREMSYAHAFSRGDYNCKDVLPSWAKQWLQNRDLNNYDEIKMKHLNCLEACNSGNDIWNAMQKYLVSTGELHNNVRMSWGKMIVHWKHYFDSSECDSISHLLYVLCYLNDRFALDGLSPPSYAGLLWCIGWCDKPDSNGGISMKKRYKLSVTNFEDAKKNLLKQNNLSGTQTTILSSMKRTKRHYDEI